MRRKIILGNPIGNFGGAVGVEDGTVEALHTTDPAFLRPQAPPEIIAPDSDGSDGTEAGNNSAPHRGKSDFRSTKFKTSSKHESSKRPRTRSGFGLWISFIREWFRISGFRFSVVMRLPVGGMRPFAFPSELSSHLASDSQHGG